MLDNIQKYSIWKKLPFPKLSGILALKHLLASDIGQMYYNAPFIQYV